MTIKKHNWLKWQEDYLRNNYSFTKIKDLANHLKISEYKVKRKCDNMGLIRNARWSKEDKEYLAANYHNTPMDLLVKYLKREASKIRSIANKMKITGRRYGLDKPKNPIQEKKQSSATEKNQQRWDKKVFPTTTFSSSGKKAVRVDRKTFVYVPITATDKEVESIVNRYRKTA